MGVKNCILNNIESRFFYILLLLFGFILLTSGHVGADCQCELTVRVNPARSGNITSPQFSTNPTRYPSVFVLNKKYNLMAVPEDGYEFIKWEVNYTTKNANPITVSVVDGPKTVTAYFQRAEEIPNMLPTADAGRDQSVVEGERITLDGSGSYDPDDGIKSYYWQQTGGAEVVLSNPSAVQPKLTVPTVSAGPITLAFKLTVEDHDGAVDVDTVKIIVNDAPNVPPTADAGDEQVVAQGSKVTLDATGSFDGNGNDDIVSYKWEQVEGTPVTLSDASSAKPTFTAPDAADGLVTLEFRLTLEDTAGLKGADFVNIVVNKYGSASGGGSGGGGGGCFVRSMDFLYE